MAQFITRVYEPTQVGIVCQSINYKINYTLLRYRLFGLNGLNQIRDSISSSSLLIRIRWYYQPNWIKCVVGKAYGFSSIYISERKKCSRLGWRFIFYFLILLNSKIEKTKRIFADHWNKEHSEIKNRNKVKINTNFTIKKAILDDRQL